MPGWTKTAVIDWFRQHAGKAVVLRQPSTLLRVTGTIRDVGKLEACSADYETVDFECGLDDVQTSLSFHDTTLSLHVLAKPLHRQEASLSVPVSIPYADLDLSVHRDGKPDDPAAPPPKSPYELLH
jgi:hypothetical protein